MLLMSNIAYVLNFILSKLFNSYFKAHFLMSPNGEIKSAFHVVNIVVTLCCQRSQVIEGELVSPGSVYTKRWTDLKHRKDQSSTKVQEEKQQLLERKKESLTPNVILFFFLTLAFTRARIQSDVS